MKITPKMPVSWEKYEVVYRYMDTDYHIKVVKDNNDEITLDNKVQSGNTINLVNDGIVHQVQVKAR